MTKSHAAGWTSESPTAAQLAEFFRQVGSGRITGVRLQAFLRGGDTTDSRFRLRLFTTLNLAVSRDYVHRTRLADFREVHGSEFFCFNSDLTDEHFPNPSVQLTPGQELNLEIFQITTVVTSEDCLAFLKSRNALLLGAQGASIVYELAKDRLVKNRSCVSFDEKNRLWRDVDGRPRVPRVSVYSDGAFDFSLGRFEMDWRDGCCLLCFRNPE
ncbi:MAG: hypothetical protein Q8Q37_03160 [bacterium]|nr:hypothetical protein [bacterium]